MIAQIEGELVKLNAASGIVRVGPLCYEVMMPGYVISALAGKTGAKITLATMEYYEGTPGGGNLIPRMIGFLTNGEKDFFTKFTSVKGLGVKKGLKSLAIPIATIAAAVESGDDKILMSLPSIGKRMSQLIIAELQGKLGEFAAEVLSKTKGQGAAFENYQVEAMEILVAWGEKRTEAMELIALACSKHPNIKTAEELVPLVYRIKQGIEV